MKHASKERKIRQMLRLIRVHDTMILGGKRKTLKRKKRMFTRPRRWKYKSGKQNFNGSAMRRYKVLNTTKEVSISSNQSSATQGNTKKKKKKRWKTLSKIAGSESGFELNGDTGFVKLLGRNMSHEKLSDASKKTDVTMSPNAHQVFEKMTKRRKKKKRPKDVSDRRNRNNHKHKLGRNKVKRRRNSCNQFCSSLELYGMPSKMLHKTKKQRCESAYQMFEKMSQRGDRVTTKRNQKFTKTNAFKFKAVKVKPIRANLNEETHLMVAKRLWKGQRVRRRKKMEYGKFRKCKFKPGKGDQLKFQSHMKREFKSQRMRRMKGFIRVKGCWVVLDKLLLWEIQVKKKKPHIGNKVYCHQMLDDVLLSNINTSTRKKKPKDELNYTFGLFGIAFLPGLAKKKKKSCAQSMNINYRNLIWKLTKNCIHIEDDHAIRTGYVWSKF
ncbi:unnamed protein product [Arabidopsis halleri]